MILLIDNYDSFTYNVYQYLSELGQDVRVHRNNEITLPEIAEMKPERIVISPGPSVPQNAGISNDVIREYGGKIPLLGICLGHQCIGYTYGGVVSGAKKIMHGKSSLIHHNDKGIFRNMPNPFSAIRYHSLAILKDSLPECLEVTAWTDDEEIMGVMHKEFNVQGMQFHPESFMTENGKLLLENFINGER